MFDISWSEFLLIGVVALIVIGPKELPAVMRTLGQWTRKLRGMASEFQNQFQEALREAEMADLKKQVDDLAQDVKSFDPLKGVRDDIASVGEEVQQSLATTPEPAPALPVDGAEPAPPPPEAPVETLPAALEAAPAAAADRTAPAPAPALHEQSSDDAKPAGAAGADVASETTAIMEKAVPADGTGRSG